MVTNLFHIDSPFLPAIIEEVFKAYFVQALCSESKFKLELLTQEDFVTKAAMLCGMDLNDKEFRKNYFNVLKKVRESYDLWIQIAGLIKHLKERKLESQKKGQT